MRAPSAVDAVLAGVLAVWWAARRLWGVREGLVAAAMMAFAFLPVTYSRIALTDVGALVGVALSLWLAVRAYDRGKLRDYALAGAFAGLALSFKYTAGLALLFAMTPALSYALQLLDSRLMPSPLSPTR